MKEKTQSQAISPSLARIAELKSLSYNVCIVHDGDPSLYGWLNTKSGASQGHMKDKQPYRRSAAQAWEDCDAYESCRLS